MFGRRQKQSLLHVIRGQLWPRRGFRRVGKYIVARLHRLKRSPHSIAAGFAAGAAASFTPLIGVHILLGIVVAFLTRGSMIAAAFGTAVGNPLTFPLIFAGTYWLGQRLIRLGTGNTEDFPVLFPEADDELLSPETEAAAEAVIDAAERFFEGGWDIAIVSQIWPIFKTMLVGSLPVSVVAYIAFYLILRNVIGAVARRRAMRDAHSKSRKLGNV